MSDDKQASGTPRTDALIANLDTNHDIAIAFVWRQMVNHARTLERELLAAQSELAESRRANAMLREALQGARLALPVLQTMLRAEKLAGPDIAEAMARRADYVLSASAAEHKAWEDALWGEPVAMIKVDVRKPEWPTNLHWILQLIDISMLPAETSLYAKPKGLK